MCVVLAGTRWNGGSSGSMLATKSGAKTSINYPTTRPKLAAKATSHMLPLLTASSQGLPAPGSAALQSRSDHTNFQCANGLTMQDVAKIWVSAISPLSGEDAAAMCVPAVAIAAGSSFDVKGCEKKFQPDVAAGAGGVKGLWQIADKFYDPDPKKQAEAVYTTYSGNDRDYGCMSTWCQESKDCSEGHFGIGQDEKIMENHRFCKGVWTADTEHYVKRVTELGGIDAIRSACSSASKEAGAGVVGNGKRIASTPEEAQLMDFLRQQLMTIFNQDATENMVSKLGEALAIKGMSSVSDAAREIGQGDVSKADEICGLARVDLEGQLLKEWLSDDAAKAMMTISPKEAASQKAEADEDEQQLTDYLQEKFAGIYKSPIPEEMTKKIVEVMVSRGVGSLGDAFETIGLGESKEAEEIVTMSRLDLEPQLLKEFFDPSKRDA